MSRAISPTRQKNAVSEGFALGLLMCGRDELPNNKALLDGPLERAWTAWSYRTRFPYAALGARTAPDPTYAMTRADTAKHTLNFYWETDGTTLRIRMRGTWTWMELDPDAAADTIDGDVPAEGWKQLAEALLKRLELA